MFSVAWAQDAATPATNMGATLMSVLPFLLVFAVFYFVLMRPQMLAAKAHAKMLSELKKGDLVMTDGGMVGEIGALQGSLVQLKLAEGIAVLVLREAVKATVSGDIAKDFQGGKKR